MWLLVLPLPVLTGFLELSLRPELQPHSLQNCVLTCFGLQHRGHEWKGAGPGEVLVMGLAALLVLDRQATVQGGPSFRGAAPQQQIYSGGAAPQQQTKLLLVNLFL